MTDYKLSKLFFELQNPALRAAYRRDRESVLAHYGLKPEIVRALLTDDVAALAPHVNAYLLRYYFSYVGMPDDLFIARLHASAAKRETAS